MVFAIGVFTLSLLGIIVLFAIKHQEQRSGQVFLPTLRMHADTFALRAKVIAYSSRGELEKLPPLIMALGRTGVHELALLLASLARRGEAGAHKLADVVSHKHRFERRAPRSEFLKQVSDRNKGDVENGNASSERDGSAQ